MIVVDTDVIIDFFSNVFPATEVLSGLISRQETVITPVSVFELYAGIQGKKRLSQIEMLIRNVTVVPLDAIEAAMAGKIYTQLKSKGQLIGTHDILIGAICLANGLPLYTKNVTHFSRIDRLKIVTAEEILQGQA